MSLLLSESRICGPPTNLEFLAAILASEDFRSGHTVTSFLESFNFRPSAIDVLSGGAYTLIQDLPGRPAVGKGIPHSGALDPLALSIANMMVGNPRGTEGLEITLDGPELRFIGPAVVALCGAQMETSIDGAPFPMWTRKMISAGQKLKIGKIVARGCRSYLAVYGGFPSVAEYFESKSTSPIVNIGGYQGRALASGDLLTTTGDIPEYLYHDLTLPERLRPVYSNHWEVMAMVGPHDEGYIDQEGIEMIYNTEWKVSHNASRSAIRLVGPIPKWAREDGGEGGAHPSNVVEYGYNLGALNWTGDDPCIFPVDCPNFGGFISSTSVIRAEFWKLGQIKAGDTMRYRRVSLVDALAARGELDDVLDTLESSIKEGKNLSSIELRYPSAVDSKDWGKSIVWKREAEDNQPAVRYRQVSEESFYCSKFPKINTNY